MNTDTQEFILSEDDFRLVNTALRVSHELVQIQNAILQRHGLIDRNADFDASIEGMVRMLRAAEAVFAASN
jgi:hypothetical protein